MASSTPHDDYDDDDDNAYLQAIGDYKPGSITKIELENFMTHAKVEMMPGPRLNMVIGANGTGKSTILNAICLGLGGDPKLLGRADDLKAFCRHGTTTCRIVLHLQPHPNNDSNSNNTNEPLQPAVLERVIDATKGKGGSSTFFINGQKSSVKQVRQLVAVTFQIAIHNLCTFLPQDKVGDFSGFSDQLRLLETEKTFSSGADVDQYYYNLHQELIQAEEELRHSAGNVETVQAELAKKKHELEQLEREKERMEERQQALDQADLYRKKLHWLKFEEHRAQAVELKNERATLRDRLQQAQAAVEPFQTALEQTVTVRKGYETQIAEYSRQVKECQSRMKDCITKYEKHDDKVEEIMTELNQMETRRTHLEQERNKAVAVVDKYQGQIAQANVTKEQIDQRVKQAQTVRLKTKQDYEQAKRQDHGLGHQMRDLEDRAKILQTKLAKLNDEASQRRDRIFRSHQNLGKMSSWLDQNRGEFRRKVWGPIACEVVTRSKNAAAFLEFHTPNAILKSYVVETEDDYKKMYYTAKKVLKVPVNVILVKEGRLKPMTRMYSKEKFQVLKSEHGVIGYLDESFTAPEPVLQALRDYASVHKVLVGAEETHRSIDEKDLLKSLNAPDPNASDPRKRQSAVIFSSKRDQSFRFTVSNSRFQKGDVNVRQDDVREAKMLAPGVNPRIKKEHEDKLGAVHDEMNELRPSLQESQQKVSELENNAQDAQTQLEHQNKMKANFLQLHQKLRRAQQKLEDIDNALQADDLAEKRKLVKELMKRVESGINALETHKNERRKMIDSTIAQMGVSLGKAQAAVAEKVAIQNLTEKEQESQELQNEVVQINDKFRKAKQKASEVHKVAVAEAPLEDEDGNPLPLKLKLEALDVQTVAEAEAAHDDVMQTANRIQENDGVVRHYEALKEEVAHIEKQLDQLSSSKEAKLALISEKSKPWESALTNHIYKINCKFSSYMKEMGCTGEVRLKKGDKGDDVENESEALANYKDWGIQIYVSYRENAKAQILSAQRHSGGERSVATILYLMAIQDLMSAPFRCVDEINQGLDERNERLVFRRIVANSTGQPKKGPLGHSGQYFLITPKLLPFMTDMENEGVNVHIVFNGTNNFDSPSDWTMKNLLATESSKRSHENSTEESENSQNGNRRRSKKGRKSRVLTETEV